VGHISSSRATGTSSRMVDYGSIAAEYYDERAHPTCRNFLRLSRTYIADQLATTRGDQRILEVGAGESAVALALSARGCGLSNLEITDLDPTMLERSAHWRTLGASLFTADATALRHRDASVDCIVASLADPYNTPAFWRSLARVLAPGGVAIVTLPSFEWAVRFRDRENPAAFETAEFVLRNGEHVRVPSVIRPLSQEMRMIEDARFAVVDFRSLGAEGLQGEVLSPKVRVFEGLFSSLVWGFRAIKQEAGTSKEHSTAGK
jgi:ubiquinone/menaquinone biosynthesis C-methylase UbiE